MSPFFVLATPRSRTAWMSAWLSYGGRMCWHDAIARNPTLIALSGLAEEETTAGFVETAGSYFPRTLLKNFPDARFGIVYRDEDEVAASLTRLGKNGEAVARASRHALHEACCTLTRANAQVMVLGYEDLNDMERLRAFWKFLRGDSMPFAHTAHLMQMNIQKIKPFDGLHPTNLLLHEAELEGTLS